MLTPGALADRAVRLRKRAGAGERSGGFLPAAFTEYTSLVTPDCTSDCEEREVVCAIVLSAFWSIIVTVAD